MRKITVVLFLFVVGFLVLSGCDFKGCSDALKDAAKDMAKSPEELAKEATKGLVLQDWSFKAKGYGMSSIVGTVKNTTNKSFPYVHVEFNLYDKAGRQVESAMDNIANLEAHGVWKFEAVVLSEDAKEAKFKGFTCL